MTAAVAHDPPFDLAPEAVAPTLAVVAQAPAGETHAGGDPEARSFGRAVVVGILIGLPAMAALLAVAVHLVAPEISPAGVAAIAGWTALFCGPFLAGTVTVGRWSSTHH